MTSLQSDIIMALTCAALGIVFVVCVLGVRARIFRDSFWQRVGLGIVAFGALAEASHVLAEDIADPYRAVLYGGLALYACATVIKWYRLWLRHGRPQHPFRRSTDFAPDEPGAADAAQQDLQRVT